MNPEDHRAALEELDPQPLARPVLPAPEVIPPPTPDTPATTNGGSSTTVPIRSERPFGDDRCTTRGVCSEREHAASPLSDVTRHQRPIRQAREHYGPLRTYVCESAWIVDGTVYAVVRETVQSQTVPVAEPIDRDMRLWSWPEGDCRVDWLSDDE